MYDDIRFIFEEFHHNFRLFDAVDILLMSVFFYLTLKWFLQAASRGVLTGVSILAVVYFLARGAGHVLDITCFSYSHCSDLDNPRRDFSGRFAQNVRACCQLGGISSCTQYPRSCCAGDRIRLWRLRFRWHQSEQGH